MLYSIVGKCACFKKCFTVLLQIFLMTIVCDCLLINTVYVCVWMWCNCSPYIIGTMNQSTSASVANLQLHHNFRWVLCSPHTEPVRGFLSRYLRRRLISSELQTGRDSKLERVVNWLPTVLERVNKFLENQSSSDLTLGTHIVDCHSGGSRGIG